ncbi:unnamed protein product [Musa banksii]
MAPSPIAANRIAINPERHASNSQEVEKTAGARTNLESLASNIDCHGYRAQARSHHPSAAFIHIPHPLRRSTSSSCRIDPELCSLQEGNRSRIGVRSARRSINRHNKTP